MTQYSLKDYVTLIAQLLQCPEGEEWALLHRAKHLVNTELVQVIEQIAQNFLEQGDLRSADFLHQWADKVQAQLEAQNLPPTDLDRYDKLIQIILDCPQGYEADIFKRYDSLIDTNLINRMTQLAQKFEQNGNEESSRRLRSLVKQLEQASYSFSSPDTELVPKDSEQQQHGAAKESTIDSLTLLSKSLSTLAEAIGHQSSAPQFSYLDTLEKAQAHQWLLTTHELQLILGTKPHCKSASHEYQRGGWRFVKSGKVGRDVLWQVFKVCPSEVSNVDNTSPCSPSSVFDAPFSVPIEIPDPWLIPTSQNQVAESVIAR